MSLATVLLGHEDDVEMATFSLDGKSVATCSRDRTVRIFDADGTCRRQLVGHRDDVLSVTWRDDGVSVVTSSDDGTIRVWDTTSGLQMAEVDCEGVQTDTVAVTRRGEIVAGDDLGNLTTIVDGRRRVVRAHSAGIKRLVINDKNTRLLSLSYDRTMKVWDLAEGAEPRELLGASIPAIVWPRSAAFLSDERVVTGTFGSGYATFDLQRVAWTTDHIVGDPSINAVLAVGNDVYTIGDAGILFRNGVAISRTGSLCNFLVRFEERILTGGQLGTLFDGETGLGLYQHRSPLNCGVTCARGRNPTVIIGSYTGEALVFESDAETGIRFIQAVKLHDNAIKGLAAQDNVLFSVCASGSCALHRLTDFSVIDRKPAGHSRIANGCVRTEEGFASVGRDRMLRLWATSGPGEAYAAPVENSIKCVAASANGRVLVVGSYGGAIAAFDVPSRQWVKTSRPTPAGISCVARTAHEGRFLASSYDGKVYQITV